jgi:hypothetical protein
MPGATIAVRQVDTNTTRSGVTDSRGQYSLPNVGGASVLPAEARGKQVH